MQIWFLMLDLAKVMGFMSIFHKKCTLKSFSPTAPGDVTPSVLWNIPQNILIIKSQEEQKKTLKLTLWQLKNSKR